MVIEQANQGQHRNCSSTLQNVWQQLSMNLYVNINRKDKNKAEKRTFMIACNSSGIIPPVSRLFVKLANVCPMRQSSSMQSLQQKMNNNKKGQN